MSHIMVAGLVLSEAEIESMPGFSPFLGSCWPWHYKICREDTPVLACILKCPLCPPVS